MLEAPLPTAAPAAPWLRTVVCGVDGLPAGHEAVRQAAALAGGGGRLELVAVTPVAGHPLFLPLPAGAQEALAEAQRIAEGVPVRTRTVAARSPAEGLSRAAAGADVLVIGTPDLDTERGVALGRVTAPLLSAAPCSVLVARRPPDLPLFDTIVVGCDMRDPIAAETAAHLAAEHGSLLRAVAPAGSARAAAAIGCGLVVIAAGPAAARVAREAPCSVLVVRRRRSAAVSGGP
jgi:nucleotide-binding universal stress UspA family protein